MAQYKNYKSISYMLKNAIYSMLPAEEKINLDAENFELGISYYSKNIGDLSKKCVIGLTEEQTFILRQKFGLNNEWGMLTFKEIETKFELKKVESSYRSALHAMYGIIRNIKTILNKEFESQESIDQILLGELNISKKVFAILQSYHIYTLGDLAKCRRKTLLEFKGIGKFGLEEIDRIIDLYALKLDEAEEEQDVFEKPINKEEILRKKKRELEKKRLAIQYHQVLLQYERIEIQKRKLEERMKQMAIEDARNFKAMK